MLLKKLLLGFGLLALTAARSEPNPSPEDVFLAGRELLAREEQTEFCSPESCKSMKDCRAKRDLTYLFTPHSYNNDTQLLSLLERNDEITPVDDGARHRPPAAGQFEDWVKKACKEEPGFIIPNDVENYRQRYKAFGDKPFKVGLAGMCGCTSVIIANKQGAYFVRAVLFPRFMESILTDLQSHYWEKPTMTDARDFKLNKGGKGSYKRWKDAQEAFKNDVINSLKEALKCLPINDKKADDKLQVAIYTRWHTSENRISFPKQIDKIKSVLAGRFSGKIKGLKKEDIKIIPYYTTADQSKSMKSAEGKVILQYNPEMAPGMAGYQVWAASQYGPNGKLEHKDNNTPILDATWAPEKNQKKKGGKKTPRQD